MRINTWHKRANVEVVRCAVCTVTLFAKSLPYHVGRVVPFILIVQRDAQQCAAFNGTLACESLKYDFRFDSGEFTDVILHSSLFISSFVC